MQTMKFHFNQKTNQLTPIREIKIDINKTIFKNNPFSRQENELKAIERRKKLKGLK